MAKKRTQTSFDDWVAVARAAAVGRAKAMHAAQTNKPVGSRYNRQVGKWLRANGLGGITPQERYWALQVLDHLETIEPWRASLPEKTRRRLNHPGCLMRRFKAATKPFSDNVACRHPATREYTLFPREAKERARRAARKTLDLFGADPVRLTESILRAAFPHPADVEQLLEFQAPRPRGRPTEFRPRSPAMVNFESSPPRSTRTHVHA